MASRVTRGQHYLGETKKQLREGYGMYKYSNSFFKYEGEWKEGKKHGHGKLLMADGGYYEGEFVNGEIQGHGFRKWAVSGNTYSGQFECGEMTGFGVLTCPDGTVYEGEFQNNMKEGHGILKYADGAVYEGSFHKNKRHGGGSQTYVNGDYFVGDWVYDQRQGGGELRFADGSVYEGQWRNGVFNGEGTLMHASGMTYEGLWINGRPKYEAKGLTVVGSTTFELTQGTSFDIHIEVRQEDGELVQLDVGRELKITAGFRHYTPPEGLQLPDMIEDVDETPKETPYGYEVINYPITIQSYLEDKLAQGDMAGIGPLTTAGTDNSTSASPVPDFNLDDTPQIFVKVDVPPKIEITNKEGMNDLTNDTSVNDATETMATVVLNENGTDVTGQDSISSPGKYANEDGILETSVPPPVNNQRTENGKASFKSVILPGAPQGYRPFQVLDAILDEEARNKLRNQKTGRLAGQLGLGAKLGKNADEIPDSLITAKLDPKTQQVKRERRYGDERFARPGEYVIMIEDVTMPAFLDTRLEPIFLLVKINHQKKIKKMKSPKSSRHKMTPDKE
ncbi:MORN repeat-containing protein 1-like isoform X2 [Antedon mediterranea]|uniref:MORN repeat-containing protein 1-like isoform X2 n=1 Tax=Antedon mediterranea TaxID=105859 RepID=UPI003AF4CE42